MKIEINGTTVTVTKEATDPKYYSESTLLHNIKKTLNGMGFDLIKKLMWKDGHLTSETQHYLRSRKVSKNANVLMIWDENYQIRQLITPWNEEGKVWLTIVGKE